MNDKDRFDQGSDVPKGSSDFGGDGKSSGKGEELQQKPQEEFGQDAKQEFSQKREQGFEEKDLGSGGDRKPAEGAFFGTDEKSGSEKGQGEESAAGSEQGFAKPGFDKQSSNPDDKGGGRY